MDFGLWPLELVYFVDVDLVSCFLNCVLELWILDCGLIAITDCCVWAWTVYWHWVVLWTLLLCSWLDTHPLCLLEALCVSPALLPSSGQPSFHSPALISHLLAHLLGPTCLVCRLYSPHPLSCLRHWMSSIISPTILVSWLQPLLKCSPLCVLSQHGIIL